MKKLMTMTNREWVAKHYPDNIDKHCIGGVECCPNSYGLSSVNMKCYNGDVSRNDCIECWNLPAKINGKYIMKEVKR